MRNAVFATVLALCLLVQAPVVHAVELALSQAVTPKGEVTISLGLSATPGEEAMMAPWLERGGDLRLKQEGDTFVLEFTPAGGVNPVPIPF